jgi:hypothetical protein
MVPRAARAAGIGSVVSCYLLMIPGSVGGYGGVLMQLVVAE